MRNCKSRFLITKYSEQLPPSPLQMPHFLPPSRGLSLVRSVPPSFWLADKYPSLLRALNTNNFTPNLLNWVTWKNEWRSKTAPSILSSIKWNSTDNNSYQSSRSLHYIPNTVHTEKIHFCCRQTFVLFHPKHGNIIKVYGLGKRWVSSQFTMLHLAGIKISKWH